MQECVDALGIKGLCIVKHFCNFSGIILQNSVVNQILNGLYKTREIIS